MGKYQKKFDQQTKTIGINPICMGNTPVAYQ